jgi:nucleoside 2-deoxyribosyltransferase
MSHSTPIRVYLASPLFNPVERAFNLEVAERLHSTAEVFLPQRDGALLTRLVSDGENVDAARERIFRDDTGAIARCDVLIAVLDGRTIDEGVAFELGYARALGKVCIAYKSDDRFMLPTGDNPMITIACQYHCSNLEALVEAVALVHFPNPRGQLVGSDNSERIPDSTASFKRPA